MRQKIFREKTKNISLGKSQIRKKRKEGKTTTAAAGHLAQRNGGCRDTLWRTQATSSFTTTTIWGVYRGRFKSKMLRQNVSFSLWIEKRYLVFLLHLKS
jgi:hypothetical protein